MPGARNKSAANMTAGFMRNETRRGRPTAQLQRLPQVLIRFGETVLFAAPIELSDKDGASEFGQRRRKRIASTRVIASTEVHTLFSVAANAILSFFPFLLLLMTLIRYVFIPA